MFNRIIGMSLVGLGIGGAAQGVKAMSEIPAMSRALAGEHLKPMDKVAVNNEFNWGSVQMIHEFDTGRIYPLALIQIGSIDTCRETITSVDGQLVCVEYFK